MRPIFVVAALQFFEVLVAIAIEQLAVLTEAVPRRIKYAEHVVLAVVGIVGAATAHAF